MLQNKHGKRNDPNYTDPILSKEESLKKNQLFINHTKIKVTQMDEPQGTQETTQ